MAAQDLYEKAGLFIACISTFVVAATFKGTWLIGAFHWFNGSNQTLDNAPFNEVDARPFQERWHLQDLPFYIALSTTISFGMFYGVGAFFHYTYYVNEKKKPEDWKCQPDRFLTPYLLRHEILLGSLNMAIGSIASGTLTCYIVNGGKTMLYFDPLEYGLPYLIISIPGFYLLVDGFAYYAHAMLHLPFFYRNIHKYHHAYYSPTSFGAVAMHPLEFMLLNAATFVPVFIFPIHAVVCIATAFYIFYYGMMDHSGVMMDSVWPWQPDSKFHDDHHKYFHVNFGFNSKLFDWIHDSLRRDDREYGEDVFFGKGRPKDVKKTS